jgi:transposase
MEYIGIDVHQRESQVCIVGDDGSVVLERRVGTSRDRLAELLGARGAARVLLEASTDSEWVAQALETLGVEVIVADPNFAAMYATRSRRVKTDRRDARTLADACRLGAYRPAHRTSAAQRTVRAELAVREALVRTRTRYINVIRAALRREGVRVPSGSAATFARRVQALALPAPLTAVITPLLTVLAPLGHALAAVDARLARHVRTTPAAQRLCTVPGVGPVTAAAFVATLDDVGRFTSPAQVAAYVGLGPREYSSGEHQRRGPLTKTGNRRLRSLLVQAAWGYWRSRAARDTPLRHWAARLADRRGRLRAIVALARRLTRVLYALWRHGTVYDPVRLGGRAAA